MPTPGFSGWVPPNGMATPPPPAPRPRKRVRLLVLTLVPTLAAGGAVAAAALLIPPPSTPGQASASPGLIASRSEPTTTTTTPPKPPASSERPRPHGRVVKTKDGKSELTVPKHWRKPGKDADLGDLALKIGDPDQPRFVVVVTANKRNFAGFGEFAALVHDSARSNLKKMRVKHKRHLTVNGMPAVRWHFVGSSGGTRFVYWATALRGDKAFYEVIGATTPSHAAKAGPVIQQVINSFQETAIDV
ncbi:hypothetical protein GCM10025762_22770 [Haloechinothrix salitolerans]